MARDSEDKLGGCEEPSSDSLTASVTVAMVYRGAGGGGKGRYEGERCCEIGREAQGRGIWGSAVAEGNKTLVAKVRQVELSRRGNSNQVVQGG